MNVGFFIGFAVAGHYQLTENYTSLFLFATVGNFLAIVLAGSTGRRWRDLQHAAARGDAGRSSARASLAGVAILVGLVPPVVWFMLQHPGSTETLLKGVCALVARWRWST